MKGGPRGRDEISGEFDARGRRFAVVAASFNEIVVGKLVEGALACFRSHGVSEDDVLVAWVPGAFELPLAARRLASAGLHDAIVCLGAVIRGETAHFDYVAGEAARGIQDVALDTGVPVLFGVLTTDTMEQAFERAGGKHGNKGWDSAMGAMQMASALDQLSGVQGGSSPAERSGAGQAAAVPLVGAARRRRAASKQKEKE